LLLTFLLNAIWQVALIAALAALGAWLLRNSGARYCHWVWACALCLAFLVPAVTSSRVLFETDVQPEVSFAREPIVLYQFQSVPDLPKQAQRYCRQRFA
jgi:thiol:disulfide interchange protein